MPRPYPGDLSPELTADKVPLLRGRHMVMGMKIIADHSLIDATVLMLVTTLARTNPAPIGSIFGAIRNGSVQNDALKALAKEQMPANDYDLLDQCLRLAGKAAKSRDELAHSLWLVDSKLPNDVVLCGPDKAWRMEHYMAVNGGYGPTTVDVVDGFRDKLRDKLKLWSLLDFEQAERMASNVNAALHQVRSIILDPNDEGARSMIRTILSWHEVKKER